MVNFIRPKDLPAAASVSGSSSVPVDSGTAVEKATPKQIVDAGRPIATESQAIAGTDNTTTMTPLTVRQALDADTEGVAASAAASAAAAADSEVNAAQSEANAAASEDASEDAAAAAADDAVATAADRVQTGLDATATAADRVQTGLDATATAADRVQTGLDATATAADRVQTGLDAAAAEASATEAALYDGPKVDTFADLASVTAAMVDVGGLLRCIELGAVYVRAADAATDADLDYTGSGGVKWYLSRYASEVHPENFGATAGSGDNAAILDKVITWSRVNKVTLDGRGRTYPIATAMTAIPGTIRNLTIDASGLTATTAWRPVAAEYDAPQSLTANTVQDARVFNCTAHGYSVGDVVLVTSDKVFETSTSARCAHWGRITAVSANQFTTAEAALCNLMTADNAIVRKLPPQEAPANIDVRMIGGPNCGNGFFPIRFTDLEVKLSGEGFANRNVLLQENYRPYVSYVFGERCDASGLGYVCGLAGNGWARVDLAIGLRSRHVIVTGASGTIPTVGGSVGDVTGNECLSAALDTHPATLGFVQTGKTVCDMSDQVTTEDGMVWQGVGGEFDVTFTGEPTTRHGVLVQPAFDATAFQTAPSYHIKARGINAGSAGVFLDLDGCGAIDTVECDAYGKSVSEFVYLDLGPVALETLIISGRGVSTTARCVRIICEATSDLGFVQQTGDWTAGASEAIYILGQTDAGSRTTEWAVSLCKSRGGTYGLRAANKVDAIVGAAFLSGTTAATLASPAPATVTVLS